MIVRVNVVLNRTVVDSDWCSDNLCGSLTLKMTTAKVMKGQSLSTTVLFRTTFIQTIILFPLLWNGIWIQTFQSFNLGLIKKLIKKNSRNENKFESKEKLSQNQTKIVRPVFRPSRSASHCQIDIRNLRIANCSSIDTNSHVRHTWIVMIISSLYS